ncbi:MAG: phosphatidylserine decarboxylase [Patescibacteria group bacterium]|nr:phosphatidylserine decarboxylase [Patescibacteria group bacterium]
MTPIYIRPEMFYAPASGVILYAHPRLKPDEALVVVKGRKLTTRDLLDDQTFSSDALVIGIFMTEYDIHINRCPTAAYLTEEHITPYLFTHNFSMMLEQTDILSGKGSNQPDMGYLFPNERCVVRFYAPTIKAVYYCVQIAERDVDEICNWGYEHQGQCDRYGMVRYGSQVDIVVPLKANEDRFEVLAKKNWHVEVSVDPIIRVKDINDFGRVETGVPQPFLQ